MLLRSVGARAAPASPRQEGTPRGPRRPAGRAVVVGLAVAAVSGMAVAFLAAGSAPQAPPEGLPDAGALVRWGVPAGRVLVDLCAVMAVGCLLLGSVLLPGGGRGSVARYATDRARRSAARWAAAWSAGAMVLAALSAWDVMGVPPHRLPLGDLLAVVGALPAGRALTVSALLAAAVALLARRGPARGGSAAALAVAVVGLMPPVYAGHAAHVIGHDVATGALVVHVVAASVWIGGLVALVLHVRADDPLLPAAAVRFGSVALGAFGALLVSGGLVAAASLGPPSTRWTSPYAVLAAAKLACAVTLGVVGWAHRRWTLVRLRTGDSRAFTRLAAAEVVLMGAAVGLAVSLSRTPGATGSGLLERPQRAVGPGGVAEHVSLGELVADWRPEPVLTTAAVVGLVVLGRWSRHRDVRSAGRAAAHPTALAAVAAVLLVLAVGMPTGYDGHPLVAVQAGQLVVLLLVVPLLVAAAIHPAPVRQAEGGSPAGLQQAPDRPGLRLLTDAGTGFAAVVVVTVAVLASPLRVLAVSGPLRVVLPALVLAAGVLVAVSVWGLGPGAAGVRRRTPVLVLTVAFLGLFGAVLVGGAAGAGAWTAADLSDPTGLGPAGDPRVAGWVVCASAVVLAAAGAVVLPGQRRREAAAAGPAATDRRRTGSDGGVPRR